MSLSETSLLHRCQHLLELIYQQVELPMSAQELAMTLLDAMRLNPEYAEPALHEDLWDQKTAVMIKKAITIADHDGRFLIP